MHNTWRACFACLLLSLAVPIVAENSPSFSLEEQRLLSAFGPWPITIPDDPGNELSGKPWAEQLGQQLFSDPKLSGGQNISCATCHNPNYAFTDGLATAVGAGIQVRNTQGLYNVGLQRWFGWDGGADSLWSASIRPLLSEEEMNGRIDRIARYMRNEPYVQAWGRRGRVDLQQLSDLELLVLAGKSLAAFQRKLVSPVTPFDRYLQGLLNGDQNAENDFPEQAKKGMKLFFGEGNCFTCHFGPNFSNGEFHDIGRPFFTGVGRIDSGRHSGIKRVRRDRFNLAGEFNGDPNESEIQKTTTVKLGQVNFGQWRTPSLRELVHTAPYMHDGSLATLRDVVDSYADIDPMRLHSQGELLLMPRDWSEDEREALTVFLQTLSH